MEAQPVLDPVSAIVSLLLSFGLPGVVIIALGYFAYLKDQRNNDLQDTLINMARDNAKAMAENTAAINGLSNLLASRGNGSA